MNTYYLKLVGDYVYPMARMIFYCTMGHLLKGPKINPNRIFKNQDMRIPCMLILPQGSGKKDVESLIIQILRDASGQENPETIVTSYHPEQFIGTQVKDENTGEFENMKGYLGEDFIIKNEAYHLVHSKRNEHQIARNYLKEALDPYGHNKITKRRVASHTTLQYYPFCSVFLELQPATITEDALKSGLMRRFIIYYSEDIPRKIILTGKETKGYEIKINLNPVFTRLSHEGMVRIENEANNLLEDAELPMVELRWDFGYNTMRFAICNMAVGMSEDEAIDLAIKDAQIFYESFCDFVDKYSEPEKISTRTINIIDMLVKLYQYSDLKLSYSEIAKVIGKSRKSVQRYMNDIRYKYGVKL
jgi:hypothetical protein